MAYTVDSEGKVAQSTLTLDRAMGDQWLVSSGLRPGDRVIVEGTQKIRPGSPVKAVEWEPAGKESSKAQTVAPPPKSN